MLKNGLITLSSLSFLVAGPAIANEAVVNDTKQTVDYQSCGNSDATRKLGELVVTDGDQQRTELTCNALLSKIAQKKAEEMAAAGEITHYGSGGTPDERLIAGGYPLYLPKGATGLNHVEAIQGGYSRPGDVLDNFKNSYAHRVHLFGEHEFYLQQNEIGVGYAKEWSSPHVDYWVVYIASRKNHPTQKKLLSDNQTKKKDVMVPSKPMK